MLKMFVTESATISLSGTFFCVHTTTESVPRTAIEVYPKELTALNAYSTWYILPSAENTFMTLSICPKLISTTSLDKINDFKIIYKQNKNLSLIKISI